MTIERSSVRGVFNYLLSMSAIKTPYFSYGECQVICSQNYWLHCSESSHTTAIRP